jgi:hypothetical protein
MRIMIEAKHLLAGVAKLADAQDLKSCED